MFSAIDPIFPAKLRLLRSLLRLDFGSTVLKQYKDKLPDNAIALVRERLSDI